jgi:C4-dicarboxylate-specific signal transduction histidine kinase
VPVVVSVRDNAKHWVLAVQDQGGGVAPSLLPRLGYDIVESNVSQGMGLYLLNALLMRLGGCLQIKNIQGGAQVEAHFPKAV